MGKDNYDVVVIGAVGVDTNVYLPGQDIDFDVEANFTTNIDYPGLAGSYTSRGFARLVDKVAVIAYIGEDHNGWYVKNELEGDGIDCTFFLDPVGTKRSINFMYKDGRRKNFYDGKASMEVKPDIDICKSILKKTNLAHFNIVNWTRYLLPVARELGVTISCDIQDITDLDDEYRQDFINYADVLFFSAVNFKDPVPLIKEFIKRKPDRIVICGMGDKGCALGTEQGIKFYKALDMLEPVVDTNGAGDGLAVGFLSSYFIDGFSLEDSILRGQIVARYTCTKKATSSELITGDKLNKYFEEMKESG
ncbi:carbohydrate kinase family protein [Halothermothrix orenii]|uniref:PfkB domain protein n=1 Tax=Halothermothrix orenii (strain H 168 / OCM 544 / DSM 9562) TaxID=373903 RepID=B8CWQ8_HALOH|nr:carbohydrate kinase family protein [Halothermothrix orenii]ACL69727.1 PfkB domain protein [Halothermothrix orenii H 168]